MPVSLKTGVILLAEFGGHQAVLVHLDHVSLRVFAGSAPADKEGTRAGRALRMTSVSLKNLAEQPVPNDYG